MFFRYFYADLESQCNGTSFTLTRHIKQHLVFIRLTLNISLATARNPSTKTAGSYEVYFRVERFRHLHINASVQNARDFAAETCVSGRFIKSPATSRKLGVCHRLVLLCLNNSHTRNLGGCTDQSQQVKWQGFSQHLAQWTVFGFQKAKIISSFETVGVEMCISVIIRN